VMGFYKCCNKSSNYVEVGKFFDQLSDCELFKPDCVPWIELFG